MLYMFLAEGFEETEAIGALDVIRRAGIEIKTVSIGDMLVCGAHGVSVKADILKDEIDASQMSGVIVPGGMPGTTNLQKDEVVQNALALCMDKGLLVGAICAAPMILGEGGFLKGKNAVCYPGFEKHLSGATIKSDLCVTDGNIITAKGAGAAMIFGGAIVDYFKKGEGREILDTMQHA